MADKNKSFSYSYSGAVNEELEQLKEKYTPKEVNEKMKRIRIMDKKVDFISTMFSIFLGIIGSIFLITGTIILIKNLFSTSVCFITILIGIVTMATVPFIHAKIYNFIKQHYAPEILALIKEIEHKQI